MIIMPEYFHCSWNDFVKENKKEIEKIQINIGSDINPEPENILRFMQNDLNSVKIVILGQDPYPEKGRATGRAFEVGDLYDWNEKFRQVSLKNIIRLIHKSYNNIEKYDEIRKFSQIQKEIREKNFLIEPPGKLFKSWEKQGVLLLNAYLSVKTGEAGSHRDKWEKFGNALLNYISEKNQNIIWFLWGKKAEEKSKEIIYGKKIISRHPMMCSPKYEDDFLRSPCFKDTMNLIDWLGKNT